MVNIIKLFNTPSLQLTTLQKYQIGAIEMLFIIPFIIVGAIVVFLITKD